MLFKKFIDLLPYFGLKMEPFADVAIFHRSLNHGTSFASLSEDSITLNSPKGAELLPEGFTKVESEFDGFEACRAALDLSHYEDINSTVAFLLSGHVGAFYVAGFGYVIEGEIVRLLSTSNEFLNEQDFQLLLERRKARPNDAILHNFIGKFCVELGREGEAAGYFADAAKAEPRFAEPYSNLGALMWRAGLKEKSFNLFCDALIRHPFSVDIQDNFIGTGLDLGQHAKMKETIERVTKGFPDYPGLLYLHALLSLNLGDSAACRNLLLDLLAKEPKDERAKSLLQELES